MILCVLVNLPQLVSAQPFNDDWDSIGSDLDFPFTTSGSNVNATVEPGEQNLASPPTGSTVWWFFQAPASGLVTINTNGSNFDTVLHVFTDFQNGFGNFTLVGFDDDSGEGFQSSLTFMVNAGQIYEVRVGGFGGGQGNIVLNSPPANDEWSGPFLSVPFFEIGTNVLASVQPLEQNLEITGATVWWFVEPTADGTLTINTNGSNFDTVLHVFTDFQNGFGNFTLVGFDDDSGEGFQSSLTFIVEASRRYEIRVGGFGGGHGNIAMTGTFIPDEILIGDVNLDAVVNLLDVQPFVALLTGGGFQAEADINTDGMVSLLDVQPFVEILTGP